MFQGRLCQWQVLSVGLLICLGITNVPFKNQSKLTHSPNCNLLHHTTLQFHLHKLPTNYQTHTSKFISFPYYFPQTRGMPLLLCLFSTNQIQNSATATIPLGILTRNLNLHGEPPLISINPPTQILKTALDYL